MRNVFARLTSIQLAGPDAQDTKLVIATFELLPVGLVGGSTIHIRFRMEPGSEAEVGKRALAEFHLMASALSAHSAAWA